MAYTEEEIENCALLNGLVYAQDAIRLLDELQRKEERKRKRKQLLSHVRSLLLSFF